ncbi:hypothetical protein GKQ38_01655 [Candidatus Nanohaloarchaea archaeon]|nr:hypothetical protein GKQ38_01655 [Candidatus Nanohaloarchaea archaeon]
MSTHKIVPYEIKLHEPNGWYYNLQRTNNIPELYAYDSFEDFMAEFLENYKGASDADKDRKKTFSAKYFHKSNKNVIGRIRTGEWGYEQDRFNIDNENREENAVGVKDSMEIDFFFQVTRSNNLPKESAVLVMEQFKGMGAKTEFERKLSAFIGSNKVKVEVNRLFTKDIVRQLRKADELLRFKLETEKGPDLNLNHEERINDERGPSEITRQTIEIKPDPGGGFFSCSDLIDKIRNDEKIGFSRAYDFNILDVGAVVNESGSERTVSLDEGDAVKMVDILKPSDPEVRITKGRVRDGSLSKFSENLIEDLISSYQDEKITNFPSSKE